MIKSLKQGVKKLHGKLTLSNDRARLQSLVYSLHNVEKQLDAVHRMLSPQVEQFERDLLKEDRYADPKKLNRHEKKVFSQFGEDGIIAEIFRRIGILSKTFVEIGVGDGLENNTTFLLLQGWSGCWVEGGAKEVEEINNNLKGPIAEGKLKVVQSFVTAENIGDTLKSLSAPDEIDLLSIDIDRNTYYIWEALKEINARVIVIEYNPSIPPDVNWKVGYDPTRVWNGTDYMGASLKAYEELAGELGYCLVGCSLGGANAFFVRKDLCGERFLSPFTSENHYEPPRYFLARPVGHPPAFNDET